MKLPTEGAGGHEKEGFDLIALKVIFQGPKDQKKSNISNMPL